MTTLERTILESVTRYERESGRKLPDKSIVLDILRREQDERKNQTLRTRQRS